MKQVILVTLSGYTDYNISLIEQIKKTSDNKKVQENTKKETKSSSLFSKIKTLPTKNLK